MTTYFKRFKQFSKYESAWCFWILNVRWKYLAGTLLRFRCFPSVIACHRWVLGWKMWQTLDGARLRGWSPHRKMKMARCRWESIIGGRHSRADHRFSPICKHMHHKWPERFCDLGDFEGMITSVPFCPARILLSPAGKWDQDGSTQCATEVFQLICNTS